MHRQDVYNNNGAHFYSRFHAIGGLFGCLFGVRFYRCSSFFLLYLLVKTRNICHIAFICLTQHGVPPSPRSSNWALNGKINKWLFFFFAFLVYCNSTHRCIPPPTLEVLRCVVLHAKNCMHLAGARTVKTGATKPTISSQALLEYRLKRLCMLRDNRPRQTAMLIRGN